MLNVKPRSQVSLCRFVICLLMLLGKQIFAEGVPDDCTQLMLGIAPTWNSMRGELRLFERPRGGELEGCGRTVFRIVRQEWSRVGNRNRRCETNQGCTKKSETVVHPREFSRSEKSSDMTHSCRPEPTIRIIKSPMQTFGAMMRDRPTTIATS